MTERVSLFLAGLLAGAAAMVLALGSFGGAPADDLVIEPLRTLPTTGAPTPVAPVAETPSAGGAIAAAPTAAEGPAVPTPAPSPPQAPIAVAPAPTDPIGAAVWLQVADRLAASTVLPSDCPLPLDEPASLPNSDRSYRGGVHQGIDFICQQTGRTAVAALPGRVVVALDSWVEPTPADRDAVLGVATSLGRTPPWSLAFLYGRFVVLDHGVIPGVGHVSSVYAHLAQVEPGLRAGAVIPAGAVIGEIGNAGTSAAGTGVDNPRSLHLHWELLIDDRFLGEGLTTDETVAVYQRLFRR